MGIFHGDNCRKVFYIINDYKSGDIDITTARQQLDECDLSDKSHFHHVIVEAIDEIYGVDE
jgi:hypothetical protein